MYWIYSDIPEGGVSHRHQPDSEEDDQHSPPVFAPVQILDDPVSLPSLVSLDQQKPLPS